MDPKKRVGDGLSKQKDKSPQRKSKNKETKPKKEEPSLAEEVFAEQMHEYLRTGKKPSEYPKILEDF